MKDNRKGGSSQHLVEASCTREQGNRVRELSQPREILSAMLTLNRIRRLAILRR